MTAEKMAENIFKHKTYLFTLDYGDRKVEKEFVREILVRFDRFSLTGCGLFINNNPYSLELYFVLSFEEMDFEFDSWLSQNYPHKMRAYNVFVDELTEAVYRRGYSLVTFTDSQDLDMVMTSNKNELFLHPDREVVEEIWGRPVIERRKNVFLSHSSEDKEIVDKFFNELQKAEIKVWYDKEEIIAGDSITSKINEGLKNCDIGVIFLSQSFLSKKSGWTEAECNYFIQSRMKKNKKLIVVNLGVEVEDFPPLLEDYLYIDASRIEAGDELIRSVSIQLNRV